MIGTLTKLENEKKRKRWARAAAAPRRARQSLPLLAARSPPPSFQFKKIAAPKLQPTRLIKKNLAPKPAREMSLFEVGRVSLQNIAYDDRQLRLETSFLIWKPLVPAAPSAPRLMTGARGARCSASCGAPLDVYSFEC